jgi:beta-lactamase class C
MDEFFKANKLKVVSLFVALLLSAGSASADNLDSHAGYNYDLSNFVDWMEGATREKEIPGVALAIVSREGIMHMQTWGVRSIDTREAVHTDSVFRIASMSKTFAGASAALLVDQNYQSWNTKLTDLFPSMNLGTRRSSSGITLKHIVSHSTGLMPHSYSNLLDDGVSYDRIKPSFSKIPTVCKPGECYGYQNVVFSIIADVVEQSTGESYEKFIYDQIFKPLGMITASVGMEAYLENDEATDPHRRSRGAWHTTSTNPAYYSVAPASGINASIFDMSIWVRANLGAFPEILAPDFLSQLHEPIIATPRGNYFNRWSGLEKAYYATGWRVFDYKGQRVVHHGGGVRGYRSEMAFVPDANIGLVLLFNAESNLANDIVPAFLDNLINTAD